MKMIMVMGMMAWLRMMVLLMVTMAMIKMMITCMCILKCDLEASLDWNYLMINTVKVFAEVLL